jgi:hypothetical protein
VRQRQRRARLQRWRRLRRSEADVKQVPACFAAVAQAAARSRSRVGVLHPAGAGGDVHVKHQACGEAEQSVRMRAERS